MCDCVDLIGLKYRLGANGEDGEIDCIHLVYTVLERLGMAAPTFDADWYTASRTTVARALLNWGDRVAEPQYDGDVLVLAQIPWAFSIVWQQGILYINTELEKVSWCSLDQLNRSHCFRMRSS
jgi:hypothetical protein